MDRLSLVAALAALACGCKAGDRAGADVRSRADTVKARPTRHADVAAMCDRYYAPADAPRFAWPEMIGTPPGAPPGRWRWINVWATWCHPCVEEVPRLLTWRTQLDVDLIFLSADASDPPVAAFQRAHPGMPDGPRLADPDTVPAWIESLGVHGASLPIHIFVDPASRVRCVRASGIDDADLPAIRALLGGPS
jgi:thiol-disulfide isomerase/thioredoxin